MSAVISLSGGMDSTTLLGLVLEEHPKNEVYTLTFRYGSKHNVYENIAAQMVAEHYGVSWRLVDFSDVLDDLNVKSNLMKGQGDIPEGHYEDESMSQTVVPGRNIIFTSFMTSYAWTIEADEVYLGIHSGDHAIYEDCRPEFYEAMAEAVAAGTGGRCRLRAPFLYDNKTSIIKKGNAIGVPYHLTRTCYKDQEISCGKCGACQERLEAFAANNTWDPIEYETRDQLPKESV